MLVAQQYMAAGEDQEAREFLAANADPGSPLLLATTALCDSDWDAALSHAASWQSGTESTRVLKAAVEATALTNTGQDDAALACLRAADPDGTLSGVQLAIAQILLGRADRRRGDQWLTEVQEAFSLAIKARDSRRSWFGDSVAPIVAAVQAAQACGDIATAWELMQEQPEGQATTREARDVRLLEHRALLAALTGRMDEARRLQGQIDSVYIKAQITALTLERENGDQAQISQLQAAWQAVWDAAATEHEQLHAAMGLAEWGVEPAGLNNLEAAHPDLVADIRLIARASRSSATGDLSVLRANVTKSPMIVILLAQHYQVTGDREQRARTLRSGAEYWRDASMMAMAAKAYRQADMPGTTRDCARDALELGGPGWPAQSRSEMYALLVDAEFAEGNPDRAAAAARSMLTLNPHDHDALWALARCHVVRGMTEDAWNVLVDQGTPVEPRTRHEALLWVALGVRYSDDATFVGQALTLMRRWPDDEELLGGFITTLHAGAAATQERWSEADGEQLRQATERYLERFPGSSQFRAVQLGPNNDPLANLADDLRQAYESTREVRDKVASGDLPLGILTRVVGRTYTEASLCRAAGFVYARDAMADAAGAEAVTAAQSVRAVIDPTVAHTLALLDPRLAEILIGFPDGVVTTDQLFQDALQAKDSLALQSDLTIVWDPEGQQPDVRPEEAGELERYRSTAGRVVEILRSTARVPHPELRSFPLPAHRGGQWLTALDHAKEHGLVLWTDDRVLRSLAHSSDVPAFGTLDLLDAVGTAGRLSTDEVLLAKAELLRHYYADIDFSHDLYTAAALADGWRAKAVAEALSRPQAWTEPQPVASFVLGCITHVSERYPQDIAQWLAMASTGLAKASASGAVSQNLKTLAWHALTQSWVTASSLPFVLAGLRCGIAVRDDAGTPLEDALAQFYAALVAELGHKLAASWLMRLFDLAPDTEKTIAARVVLTHQGS
ncbi:tetratricopeptide repeat protein [Kitasatospora sp. NBC_01250]|uniref:PIN domain-containing protein n=1 Tax=Kitasatospora sp. NBC_01250 TaxID=2903571 RepID=UPI002E314F6B|nr:tetratricopeptide repeat protein [Kitasatospora sp. NBC_01250]